ncbi:hypothetical protein [Nitrosomonas sp. Nm58]|nr:hypothetical protein [Nitrosomonas sp. Nm58]
MSRRTAEEYLKRYESGVTGINGSGVSWGRQSARWLDKEES